MNKDQPKSASNIYNAMQVLIHTYDNVKKLFDALHEESENSGYLPTDYNQYLHWMSNRETYGWLARHFIKTFTRKGSVKNELYTVEVNLNGIHEHDLAPVLILGRHLYDRQPDKFTSNEDAANFSHRAWNTQRFEIDPENGFLDFDKVFHSKPKYNSGDWGKSRGFQQAVFIKLPLLGLSAAEIKPRIFDKLDCLLLPDSTTPERG